MKNFDKSKAIIISLVAVLLLLITALIFVTTFDGTKRRDNEQLEKENRELKGEVIQYKNEIYVMKNDYQLLNELSEQYKKEINQLGNYQSEIDLAYQLSDIFERDLLKSYKTIGYLKSELIKRFLSESSTTTYYNETNNYSVEFSNDYDYMYNVQVEALNGIDAFVSDISIMIDNNPNCIVHIRGFENDTDYLSSNIYLDTYLLTESNAGKSIQVRVADGIYGQMNYVSYLPEEKNIEASIWINSDIYEQYIDHIIEIIKSIYTY